MAKMDWSRVDMEKREKSQGFTYVWDTSSGRENLDSHNRAKPGKPRSRTVTTVRAFGKALIKHLAGLSRAGKRRLPSSAPNTRKPSVEIGALTIQCDFCAARLAADQLVKHQKKVHTIKRPKGIKKKQTRIPYVPLSDLAAELNLGLKKVVLLARAEGAEISDQ